VGNAAVTALSVSGSTGAAVSADAQGNYSLYVPPDAYDLVARHPAYTEQTIPRVHATSSGTTVVQNIAVKANNTTITGSVTDASGGSTNSFSVNLLLNNSDPSPRGYVVAATTPAAGAYTLNVAAGTYSLLLIQDQSTQITGNTGSAYYQRVEYHSDPGGTSPTTYTVPTSGRVDNFTMASLVAPNGAASCAAPTAPTTCAAMRAKTG